MYFICFYFFTGVFAVRSSIYVACGQGLVQLHRGKLP